MMNSIVRLVLVGLALVLLSSPVTAAPVVLDASFESWVRDDGRTLGGGDSDLISVWSSANNLRWGVVEFDLSGLVGTTVNDIGLNLWSRPGGSAANAPLKQQAARIIPGGATSALDWTGITALSQTPFETFGSYDIPPFADDPLLQNTYIYSGGSAADVAAIQSIVDAGGLLTVVLMAVEDGTDYRQDWGDGAFEGSVPQLVINAIPEPTGLALLALAVGGGVIMFRRNVCVSKN